LPQSASSGSLGTVDYQVPITPPSALRIADGGRAWASVGLFLGPVRRGARVLGVAHFVGRLTGVLDVDEHGLAVWCAGRAGDFATGRSHQEAAGFASVARRRPASCCCRSSSGRPCPWRRWTYRTGSTARRGHQPTNHPGRRTCTPLMLPLASGAFQDGSPAMMKWFQAKVTPCEIAIFLPADDVALGVVHTGVGSIDAGLLVRHHGCCCWSAWCGRALLVQPRIHSGRSILVAPNRSLAWRALISTSPWSAKPLAAVDGPAGRRSKQSAGPLPSALNLASVQGAVVEQGGVGSSAAGFDGVAADELVDVTQGGSLRPCTPAARLSFGDSHGGAFVGCRGPWQLRFIARLELGLSGSSSTIQPKRLGSLGVLVASKRASCWCQL